ncbi:MAG: copper chaperone PCu(A)C [Rhabdaerophilum sp.]
MPAARVTFLTFQEGTFLVTNRLLSALGAVFAAFLLTYPLAAHDYTIGDLKIDHPWTRATPGGAKVAGGYMKITNNGTMPDRLIGGTAVPAGIFEVHEMKMEGNVMRMRALAKGLEIKPGQTVELKPGGLHVMFIDLKSPLKEGEKFKGTLVFEKAGTIEVEYAVEARSSAGGHGGHQH